MLIIDVCRVNANINAIFLQLLLMLCTYYAVKMKHTVANTVPTTK